MPNLISTLEAFSNLLMECNDISEALLADPAASPLHGQRLVEIRTECDEMIQHLVLTGIFPQPTSELDLYRKQFLDLSKKLFIIKQVNEHSCEADAITVVMNQLLVKIKALEDVDPSSLILD